MSSTLSPELKAHFGETTTSRATLWTVTCRDGDVFRFTDHDVDIVYSGETFIAREGFEMSAVEMKSDLSVDNFDIKALLGDAITRERVQTGKFEKADLVMDVVNWADLTMGHMRLRRGRIGNITLADDGACTAEFRSLAQLLAVQTIRKTTPGCQVDLGSPKCGIPISPESDGGTIKELARETAYALGDFVRVATDGGASGQAAYENRIYECTTAGTTAASAPSYDTTVGNTTTDGTAVFTAREAWTRHAEVATVTNRREVTVTISESRAVADDTWFVGGLLTAETGANAGASREISGWDGSTGTVQTYTLFPFDFTAGDDLRMTPGCNKSIATCRDKFANAARFRGTPHVPGSDYALRVRGLGSE